MDDWERRRKEDRAKEEEHRAEMLREVRSATNSARRTEQYARERLAIAKRDVAENAKERARQQGERQLQDEAATWLDEVKMRGHGAVNEPCEDPRLQWLAWAAFKEEAEGWSANAFAPGQRDEFSALKIEISARLGAAVRAVGADGIAELERWQALQVTHSRLIERCTRFMNAVFEAGVDDPGAPFAPRDCDPFIEDAERQLRWWQERRPPPLPAHVRAHYHQLDAETVQAAVTALPHGASSHELALQAWTRLERYSAIPKSHSYSGTVGPGMIVTGGVSLAAVVGLMVARDDSIGRQDVPPLVGGAAVVIIGGSIGIAFLQALARRRRAAAVASAIADFTGAVIALVEWTHVVTARIKELDERLENLRSLQRSLEKCFDFLASEKKGLRLRELEARDPALVRGVHDLAQLRSR